MNFAVVAVLFNLAVLVNASGATTTINYEISNQGNRRAAENTCLICSRLGTALMPENRPSSTDQQITCGSLQAVDVSSLESNSRECVRMQSFWENRCCDQSSFLEIYECEANVHSLVIDNGSNNMVVPPVHAGNGKMSQLDVNTEITYMSVRELDVKFGTLELFVNIDLTWNDPRLRWEFSNTTCVNSITVKADHSQEETQIWVPSLDLSNRATSFQDLPSSPAFVDSDGTVKWSRVGSLTAACSFKGLRSMPFDDLGCRLHFKDNGLDGSQSGPQHNIDYILTTSNDTTIPNGLAYWDNEYAYSEFSIVKEKSRTGYDIQYLANGFYIDLYFHRARKFYILFSIIPTILFTFLSFLQFAIDIKSGERLSFSITILLITVTQSIVTAALLPVCRESIWINVFNFCSMLFTLFGNVETIMISRIFVMKAEDSPSMRVKEDEEYASLVTNDVNKCNPDGSRKNPDSRQDLASEQQDVLGVDVDQSCENHGPVTKGQEHELSDDSNDWKKSKTIKGKITKIFTSPLKGSDDLLERQYYICLFVLPFIYTLFIIFMFVLSGQWKDSAAGWS